MITEGSIRIIEDYRISMQSVVLAHREHYKSNNSTAMIAVRTM